MNAHRAGLALFAVVLMTWLPSSAEAHPALMGTWSASVPPGMVTTYEFGETRYITFGVWQGSMRLWVNGCVATVGWWELRMFTGTDGTLSIKDGEMIGLSVGNVDFAKRTFTYMGVPYRSAVSPVVPKQ